MNLDYLLFKSFLKAPFINFHMNRVMDQAIYHPNVPYQQVIDQPQYPQNDYSPQNGEIDFLIKNIRIPDQLNFEHVFQLKQPCCGCCGEFMQQSSFNIDGLGLLEFKFQLDVCCSPRCCMFCCPCCVCQDCDLHDYPIEIYSLRNQNIEFEFWHKGIGKATIDKKPIFNFLQTNPNECDLFYQHCMSSYPKIQITFPHDKNKLLVLRPDKNQFPESILGLLGCVSFFDFFTLSKNYHVDGLTQGKCTIVNTRNSCQAYAKISACQGRCCQLCPSIDYPNFQIVFENVTPIDKLAIVMGLIHLSFYKQWIITGTEWLHLRLGC